MPLVEDVYVLEKELGKYVFNRSQFFSCRHLLDIGFCRGEFSTVFLATHKQTKEQFAIKVIEKNDMDTSRLENEVSILKKVRHPHIIFLKEFFDTPKKLYLVMELYPSIHILIVFFNYRFSFCFVLFCLIFHSVTGGELFKKIIEIGSYTEAAASEGVKNILSAINYLHEMGIVHRDLKVPLFGPSTDVFAFFF